MNELANYGFFITHEGRYEISHALIHTYAKRELCPEYKPESLSRLANYYIEYIGERRMEGQNGYAQLDVDREKIIGVFDSCIAVGSIEYTARLAVNLIEYLGVQGYIEEKFKVIKTILNFMIEQGNQLQEACWSKCLGNSYRSVGDLERAIQCLSHSLGLFKEISCEEMLICDVLCDLGTAYCDFGRRERAHGNDEDANKHCIKSIEFLEESLSITKKFNIEVLNSENKSRYLYLRAAVLSQLGVAYSDSRDCRRGVRCLGKALRIDRKLENGFRIGTDFGNLGYIYCQLADEKMRCNKRAIAIKHLQKAISNLKMAVTFHEDRSQNLAQHLNNLAHAYALWGKFQKAIEYCERARSIFRKNLYADGVGTCSLNIAQAYYALGQTNNARANAQEAVEIFQAIGSPKINSARQLVGQCSGC